MIAVLERWSGQPLNKVMFKKKKTHLIKQISEEQKDALNELASN